MLTPRCSPTAFRPWHFSTRFVGRNLRSAPSFAKATEGAHLAFIHGFTPVAFCEGGQISRRNKFDTTIRNADGSVAAADEHAQVKIRSPSRRRHRKDSRSGPVGHVGRQRATLGIHRGDRPRREASPVQSLPGGNGRLQFLDGADEIAGAAPSGVSRHRRSRGATAQAQSPPRPRPRRRR